MGCSRGGPDVRRVRWQDGFILQKGLFEMLVHKVIVLRTNILSTLVLYMSFSFWLLDIESDDFCQAEKERTTCKAEQTIHCNLIQIQYRARTKSPLCTDSHNEKPVFIAGNPFSHCRDYVFIRGNGLQCLHSKL